MSVLSKILHIFFVPHPTPTPYPTPDVWNVAFKILLSSASSFVSGRPNHFLFSMQRSPICFIFQICNLFYHDDVIKWKHFPRYWPFVRGIHRSPVNSPHKGQRRGALMFSLISARINGWVNNREAGDLKRIRPHYDVTVMIGCFSYNPPYSLPSTIIPFTCYILLFAHCWSINGLLLKWNVWLTHKISFFLLLSTLTNTIWIRPIFCNYW